MTFLEPRNGSADVGAASSTAVDGTSPDWTHTVATQLEWHWEAQLRPRLEGLTDVEYLWEPVPDCWNIRPRGEGRAMEVGVGDFIIDFAMPEPEPPPVTTIAWRVAHLLVGIFGDRNARYFDGPAVSYTDNVYFGTAHEALSQLDDYYARWMDGVRGLNETALGERCREPGHEADSMADLVLHIHREVIHHGAEIALLRDLYAHRVQ